jgi:hypothetical protein
MQKQGHHKFQFDRDFQSEVLHYTIKEPLGYQCLKLYDESYFEIVEFSVIAFGIKTFFKDHRKIPSKALLKEHLRVLYTRRDLKEVDDELKVVINNLLDYYYKEPVLDPDEIFLKVKDFRQYVEVNKIIENTDLTDFSNYEKLSSKIQKAVHIGDNVQSEDGVFLFKEFLDRQQKRKLNPDVVPTPFWQINSLTNAGGYPKSSLITFIGKGKRFKTAALVNFARGYAKMRKKVAYIDFENNEEPLAQRVEQSLGHVTKEELLSFEHDRKLSKLFRRYKRVGAEIVIKRFPAYTTNAEHVQGWIDMMKLKYNITFQIAIFDYIGLSGSISGKKDDTERISDAYVDYKNLIAFNKFELGISAHHITREGHQRIKSKFLPTDTAKCLDIHRHVDALWGIQETEEEAEAGVSRWEVIDQRDGVPDGNALFIVDADRQIFTEFSKKQKKEYQEQVAEQRDEQESRPRRKPKTDEDL